MEWGVLRLDLGRILIPKGVAQGNLPAIIVFLLDFNICSGFWGVLGSSLGGPSQGYPGVPPRGRGRIIKTNLGRNDCKEPLGTQKSLYVCCISNVCFDVWGFPSISPQETPGGTPEGSPGTSPEKQRTRDKPLDHGWSGVS